MQKKELKEKTIFDNELYSGHIRIGGEKVHVMTEQFNFNPEENLEARISLLHSRMNEDENSFLESNGTKVSHIIKKENSLLVVSKFPEYELVRFILENKIRNKLKGALAYNIAEIVTKLHENKKRHNNIILERFAINSYGELRLLSNYCTDAKLTKEIQPSTRMTVHPKIIEKLQEDKCALDDYKTASIIHEIYNVEMERHKVEGKEYDVGVKGRFSPDKEEKLYSYKISKKTPRKIYKILKNVLDENENIRFTKPYFSVGSLSTKAKKADSSYLLESFKRYAKYSEELRGFLADCYQRNENRELVIRSKQQ